MITFKCNSVAVILQLRELWLHRTHLIFYNLLTEYDSESNARMKRRITIRLECKNKLMNKKLTVIICRIHSTEKQKFINYERKPLSVKYFQINWSP